MKAPLIVVFVACSSHKIDSKRNLTRSDKYPNNFTNTIISFFIEPINFISNNRIITITNKKKLLH